MLNHDDFIIAALQEYGLLTRDALDRALHHAAERRIPPCDAIVSLGLLPPRDLALVRAAISECPFVDLARFEIDIRNSARLPRSVAERCQAFPLFDLGHIVTVGMADPLDLKAVDQLRALLKADVEPVLCEPAALRSLIGRAYSLATGAESAADASHHAPGELTTGEEPAVAAVNHILAQAIDEGASDVHISPDERELQLRLRIDGILQPRQGPGLSAHGGLVQRLKVMANLDLTQTRRPQDGKFRFIHAGRTADVRLSIIPTVCGENVVLRILGSAASLRGFAELGMGPDLCDRLSRLIRTPNGMILVTGPTGSGKTTTLYTALSQLNTPERNILTIEDPVEIRLPHVRQVQVNAEIGLTFAGALRSILRQAPDVVLVGEIRDEETARIAVQAALTGHLVLTTLHTNDAAGALDEPLPAASLRASA